MDPFEEMGMGARFSEQQRRSTTEKEVQSVCYWMLNFVPFCLPPCSILKYTYKNSDVVVVLKISLSLYMIKPINSMHFAASSIRV